MKRYYHTRLSRVSRQWNNVTGRQQNHTARGNSWVRSIQLATSPRDIIQESVQSGCSCVLKGDNSTTNLQFLWLLSRGCSLSSGLVPSSSKLRVAQARHRLGNACMDVNTDAGPYMSTAQQVGNPFIVIICGLFLNRAGLWSLFSACKPFEDNTYEIGLSASELEPQPLSQNFLSHWP